MEFKEFIDQRIQNESEYIKKQEDLVKSFVSKKITKIYPFSKTSLLDDSKGVYFIYEGETLLYIGCAKDRSIKKRCSQYFRKDDSGATFIHKYMEYKSIGKVVIKDSRVLNVNEVEKAIEIACNNCKFKFVYLDMDTSDNSVLFLESECIRIYKPKLN